MKRLVFSLCNKANSRQSGLSSSFAYPATVSEQDLELSLHTEQRQHLIQVETNHCDALPGMELQVLLTQSRALMYGLCHLQCLFGCCKAVWIRGSSFSHESHPS